MAVRTVIKIDEELCNGCGNCVTGCHEGALQIVDDKAVMVSDLYCDGLGACIGECPVGAITFEEREAEPYSEIAVMERILPKGKAVVLAHLNHLKEHGEMGFVQIGLDYLKERGIEIEFDMPKEKNEGKKGGCGGAKADDGGSGDEPLACGCPGSMMREIKRPSSPTPTTFTPPVALSPRGEATNLAEQSDVMVRSELTQFPVQLHLINPNIALFKGSNLLLAADCTAFAMGDFHSRFLKGRSLAIACPKLDSNTQSYVDKLVQMIDVAEIDTLTVLVMEVPCCRGLIGIAEAARERAERNVPIKVVVVSVEGEIKSERWV